MISLAETGFAIRGLGRILRFDSSFVQFYDRSREGAMRSFWIYVPLIALTWVQLILLHDPQQPPLTGRMWLAFAITEVINVSYFPLILVSIGRHIDREARIIGCIAVYNWLSLLAIIVGVPLTLLSWIGLDDNVMLILNIMSLGLVLICRGYVLAVCLQISGPFAAAFVALDYVIGEMLFAFEHLVGKSPLF
jgi:hypothetical protein